MKNIFKFIKVFVNWIELSIILTTIVLIITIYNIKVDIISISILTSIIASGIFYVITIFIPKCMKLAEMKSILNPIIDNIKTKTFELFKNIFIFDTIIETKYSQIRFIEQLNYDIIQSSKDKFVDYYNDPDNQDTFRKCINSLLNDLRKIQFNSSDYVSTRLLFDIENFKSLYNIYITNESKIEKEILDNFLYARYYHIYIHLYNITFELNNNKL